MIIVLLTVAPTVLGYYCKSFLSLALAGFLLVSFVVGCPFFSVKCPTQRQICQARVICRRRYKYPSFKKQKARVFWGCNPTWQGSMPSRNIEGHCTKFPSAVVRRTIVCGLHKSSHFENESCCSKNWNLRWKGRCKSQQDKCCNLHVPSQTPEVNLHSNSQVLAGICDLIGFICNNAYLNYFKLVKSFRFQLWKHRVGFGLCGLLACMHILLQCFVVPSIVIGVCIRLHVEHRRTILYYTCLNIARTAMNLENIPKGSLNRGHIYLMPRFSTQTWMKQPDNLPLQLKKFSNTLLLVVMAIKSKFHKVTLEDTKNHLLGYVPSTYPV